MRVVDAIAEILRREGVEFLSCYPTTDHDRGRRRDRDAARSSAARSGSAWTSPTGTAESRTASGSASSPCSTGRAPRTRFRASPPPTRTRRRCWCCRSGIRAGTGRVFPNFQVEPDLRLGHQERRGAAGAGAGRRGDAPGVQPAQERPVRAGHGRAAGRCRDRRSWRGLAGVPARSAVRNRPALAATSTLPPERWSRPSGR